jgi:hypothetical protein
MTVAPEMPPVPVAARRGSRRLRMVVDRTPAGVVALVEPPRPRGPQSLPASVVVPAAPVEPGIGREHRLADPVPVEPTQRPTHSAHPAVAPARTRAVGSRPTGARVVRPAPGHLRLTRRGRLVTVAATLLIAGLALIGVTARAGALQETAPLPASAPAKLVVAPGETLWTIAHRVAPDRDPRAVVATIQRLNDLPTSDVRAGQTLVLRTP